MAARQFRICAKMGGNGSFLTTQCLRGIKYPQDCGFNRQRREGHVKISLAMQIRRRQYPLSNGDLSRPHVGTPFGKIDGSAEKIDDVGQCVPLGPRRTPKRTRVKQHVFLLVRGAS